MASNNINDGKFYIVDMETEDGIDVAIIPDFWYYENYCYYPARRGEQASASRKVPHETWMKFNCVFRRQFDTFNAAKKLLPRAVEGTDINTASEAEELQYGKGKRVKRPRIVYSPAPSPESGNVIDSSSDEERYLNTTENLPAPPKDLGSKFQQSALQSNTTMACSQSQLITSGFYTSTQLIEDQEGQEIISNDGSTQEENNLVYQQRPSANSTAAAYVTATSLTPLIPVHRNVSPMDALYDSPSRMAVQPQRLSTPQARGSKRLPSRIENHSMQPLPFQASKSQPQMFSKENSNYSSDRQQEALFKVKVLRLLAQNLEKTTQLDGKLNVLMENVPNALSQSITENELSVNVDIPALPLKTREDLVIYEQLITTDADQFLKLVRLVKQIGGLTLSDAVKRAWETVLSLEVRAVVNWGGKKRKDKSPKHGLGKSKVTEAIFTGIRLAPEFAQVSNATLQEETRKAVKHAAETFRSKNQRALLDSASDSS